MAELTRRSNVAPLALFHCNNEEAQISGYKYDSCLHQSKTNIQNLLSRITETSSTVILNYYFG